MSFGLVLSLSGLKHCDSLQEIGLDGNGVSSLEPLRGLDELEEVLLVGNRVEDLGPLADKPKLRKLNFDANPGLATVEPLAGLPELRWINVGRTSITDLSPLTQCPKLETTQAYSTDLDVEPGSPTFDFLVEFLVRGGEVDAHNLEEVREEALRRRQEKAGESSDPVETIRALGATDVADLFEKDGVQATDNKGNMNADGDGRMGRGIGRMGKMPRMGR